MDRSGSGYQFILEFYREGPPMELVAQVPAEVDWEPALEWVRFLAVRQGCRPAVLADWPCTLAPVWHPTLGQPYVNEIRVVLEGDQEATSDTIPRAYFQELARLATAVLIESGVVEENEAILYLVCAFPGSDEPPLPERSLFSIEEVAQPLLLGETSLSSLLAEAVPCGPEQEQDMPVFLPHSVLEEAVQLADQAGAAETGGILIGHLHRDSGRPELFAEVTAQVPARQAQQELTRLTFTPEAWADVQAAIALRRQQEIYLGWWHSHPARQWCKNCPDEDRQKCKLSGDFFSGHDVALHRTVFPRAYSVALVISDSYATGLTCSLFGWRRGMVQQRGYYLLGAGAGVQLPRSSVSTVNGDDEYALNIPGCKN